MDSFKWNFVICVISLRSSRIENYAGFPDGITGRDLAHLVYLQALKFGADFQRTNISG
jgi:thioredoxin reductase